MEEVKDVRMTLYIKTNRRTVEEQFSNLFDLKTFMDDFFCSLKAETSEGQKPSNGKARENKKKDKGSEAPKRFGVLAVEKGFITLDQLVEAQNAQVMDNVQKGRHTPIGGILSRQRLLNASQINEVLRFQGREQNEANA